MTLEKYRQLRGLKIREVAEELGTDYSTVWRWLAGTRTPEPDSIRKIGDWSQGAITANDWIRS